MRLNRLAARLVFWVAARAAVQSFRDAHELLGNIVVRPFHLAQGERLERHKHGHDHITVLFRGIVACRFTVNGRDDYRIYRGPTEIPVPAGVLHEFIAITRVVAKCYWARRINRVCPGCGEEYVETGHSGGTLQPQEMGHAS